MLVEHPGQSEEARDPTGIIIGTRIRAAHIVVGSHHHQRSLRWAKARDHIPIRPALNDIGLFRNPAASGLQPSFYPGGYLVEPLWLEIIPWDFRLSQLPYISFEECTIDRRDNP